MPRDAVATACAAIRVCARASALTCQSRVSRGRRMLSITVPSFVGSTLDQRCAAFVAGFE